MPTLHTYDYAIVRVVPRVEREEFINVGVIVFCRAANFLRARIELDAARLLALAPGADLITVQAALDALPAICAGGAAAGALKHLSPRERFDWLVAPRSATIQTSSVHCGRSADLEAAMERLLQSAVRC